jgi:hypothetical protein
MLQVNPNLKPTEVRALLTDTGEPLPFDKPLGRFLDALAAVEAV